VGTLVLIVAGLVVLGYVGLAIMIQQSLPKPQQAVSAPPVAWSSRAVVLTGGVPMHGRLSLSAKASPTNQLWVGLNVGVPSVEDSGTTPPTVSGTGPRAVSLPAAGALLSGPLVRLTVSNPSVLHAGSCVAPCELELPSAFDCSSGICQMHFDFAIEVLSDGPGPGETVRVDIAGGASAELLDRLPDGLVVDLSLGDATAPPGG
jgi:hypothetical protein